MLVETYPDTFLLPRQSDMRFNWVCARMDALDHKEMREYVLDAWRMVVPKKVWTAFSAAPEGGDPGPERDSRSGS
jgi:hypothetical protein